MSNKKHMTLADVSELVAYKSANDPRYWYWHHNDIACMRKPNGDIVGLRIRTDQIPILPTGHAPVSSEPWNSPATTTSTNAVPVGLVEDVDALKAKVATLDNRANILSSESSSNLEKTTGVFGVVLTNQSRLGQLSTRIESLESHPVVPDGFVNNCIRADEDHEARIVKLENRIAVETKPGSASDAHDRIDALQAKVEALTKRVDDFSKETISAHTDLAERYSGLGFRVHALEKRGERGCQTPPAEVKAEPHKPVQPPDVAVYRVVFDDGGWEELGYQRDEDGFCRPCGKKETRTVLDAFDRLTWDDLRRWGLYPWFDVEDGMCDWTVWRKKDQLDGPYPTESACLTAARAIARKEGWR
jgi:uncharacterized coiled-coil protein SlyX